ncbi:hypothetical protein [Chitinophaga qingshengii]|uniref:Immunity protein Imm1 n=1 Tax=Chitinophaga qingshengii TaxID=1569794 RepID=A0ABR7TPV7_9BACT|nr:hypothetical protein [Chitinophaga qingshengii]MBC9932013.1 hypothetical protein [Chitinophaga qingshengii]
MQIHTTFLDKVDHQPLSADTVADYFHHLQPDDLIYSNGGYCEFPGIILFFILLSPDKISFRYDCNIPDARRGSAWYSVTDMENRAVVDAGDEQFVPLASFVDKATALEIIAQFFRQPEEKPAAVHWASADFFEWPE